MDRDKYKDQTAEICLCPLIVRDEDIVLCVIRMEWRSPGCCYSWATANSAIRRGSSGSAGAQK